LVAGLKLVIHSLNQGKGKEKSPKMSQVVVTGLTGSNATSATCAGDPARVPG
jgi:hypothetical protein